VDVFNVVCLGTLLKNIIHSSKGKISGDLLPKNRKLFLYSGHELNIAHMLHVLDVFIPHIPPYGSYILFELHKMDDVAGLKVPTRFCQFILIETHTFLF
jgi:prostatic aicd phosphatase